jgi:hypothetical protein
VVNILTRSSRRTGALLAVCGVTLALAACGGSPTQTVPTVTQTVVKEVITVTPSASPSTSVSSDPSEAEAVESADAPEPVTFTMPKLVGVNLQLAQDKLQSLGSYVLDQEDAAGLDRFQVNDSNWTVCSQRPKAGAKVPLDTLVLLASVKLSEKCP